MIKRIKVRTPNIICHYAKHGTLSSLILLRAFVKYFKPIKQYLHIVGKITCFFSYCLFPYASIEIFEWALKEIQKLPKILNNTKISFVDGAAKQGHLSIVQSAVALGWHKNSNICAQAAHNGHFHVLKWARANGVHWSSDTFLYAAWGGHLDILKWLKANKCKWEATTCSYAALGGHLEALQWLRANECPWDSSTCDMAAEGGHLEVLQWARANGCSWNSDTTFYAARHGQFETFTWAVENGCEWSRTKCLKFDNLKINNWINSYKTQNHS